MQVIKKLLVPVDFNSFSFPIISPSISIFLCSTCEINL